MAGRWLGKGKKGGGRKGEKKGRGKTQRKFVNSLPILYYFDQFYSDFFGMYAKEAELTRKEREKEGGKKGKEEEERNQKSEF